MLHTTKFHHSIKISLIFAWSAFLMLSAGIIISSNFTPDNTNATTNINANVSHTDYYLNLSSTASSIAMSATPSAAGAYVSAEDNLNVKTNIPTGYKLYLSANSSGETKNSLYNMSTPAGRTPDAITASSHTPTSATALEDNTWGYGIATKDDQGHDVEGLAPNNFNASYSAPSPAADSNWAKISAKDTASLEPIQEITHNNDTTGGNNLNIYYGTKLTSAISSGSYQGSVIYTAVGDVPEAPQPKAILCSNHNLEFVYDNNHYAIGEPCISNDSPITNNADTITAVYDAEHDYVFPYNPQQASDIPWAGYHNSDTDYDHREDITSANFSPSFKDYHPISTAYWFFNDRYISTVTNAQNLDTSQVDNISYTFYFTGYNVLSFEIQGLDTWNTSNVTDMKGAFYATGRYATTWHIGDLSEWNTSNVANMKGMFHSAGEDAQIWSVGNLSNWHTSKVTDMDSMFYAVARRATTPVVMDFSGWDTSKVENMTSMFDQVGRSATADVTIDLSSWNTSKVSKMDLMFSYTGGDVNPDVTPVKIYVGSGWRTAASASNMFQWAQGIVGEKGTHYSDRHVDGEYARIDNPPSAPGYFWSKGNPSYFTHQDSENSNASENQQSDTSVKAVIRAIEMPLIQR